MNNKLHLLLLTAALTLSAAAAYGQNQVTANIPFQFRTMAGVQAAGEYKVVPAAQEGSILKLENVQTKQSSYMGMGTQDGNLGNGRARLTFRCGDESGCILSGITMGDGRGWSIRTPRMKANEPEHVAVVYLQSKQAE
jgi:hypothetical protein